MKIHIRDGSYELLFTPERPTYAIRIDSDIRCLPRLRDSPLYKMIKKYEFNDITPEYLASGLCDPFLKPLDDATARQIITDFHNGRNGCLDLLVHCFAGLSRSPAVAKALNEIFDLGNEIREEDYPHMNPHVYNMMRKAAKEMKLF